MTGLAEHFKHGSVGVTWLLHGGLCELTCCLRRSWERVSLEVECTSSDREVGLIARGGAELGGAAFFGLSRA